MGEKIGQYLMHGIYPQNNITAMEKVQLNSFIKLTLKLLTFTIKLHETRNKIILNSNFVFY